MPMAVSPGDLAVAMKDWVCWRARLSHNLRILINPFWSILMLISAKSNTFIAINITSLGDGWFIETFYVLVSGRLTINEFHRYPDPWVSQKFHWCHSHDKQCFTWLHFTNLFIAKPQSFWSSLAPEEPVAPHCFIAMECTGPRISCSHGNRFTMESVHQRRHQLPSAPARGRGVATSASATHGTSNGARTHRGGSDRNGGSTAAEGVQMGEMLGEMLGGLCSWWTVDVSWMLMKHQTMVKKCLLVGFSY